MADTGHRLGRFASCYSSLLRYVLEWIQGTLSKDNEEATHGESKVQLVLEFL